MIDIEREGWLSELLPHVVELAREAGRAIMTVYNFTDHSVEYKCDNSPLTQADVESHHIILNGLTRLSPDWPVLSEESAQVAFHERRAWTYFWMVDPLDGTREFINRNGEFTVNIALIDKCTPILGVVYAPAIDKMYCATKGTGAFVNDRRITPEIRAKDAKSGETRIMVSRSHDKDRSPMKGDWEECRRIPMGSSLKFCCLAEGTADIYPRNGPTMEWDIAAAHCILEEAGGSIVDLNGNPMQYNKPELVNAGFLARAKS
jgi:3'(2'), 5'-bisphosphate nucleotidase